VYHDKTFDQPSELIPGTRVTA